METKVNKDLCIGCGACATIVPDVFQIGDDGLAEAITENENLVAKVPDEFMDDVRDAAEGCPTSAIEVEE